MEANQLIAGRYRLGEKVGAGGNAVVWLGVDTKLNRRVALKRASASEESGSARTRRLRREAEILAGLNHPNIVTLLDVEPDGDSVWLVMEYVELSSLDRQGVLPPIRAAAIGAQVARALQAVHAAHIVHGDVKPQNILVGDDDHAKLSDFGSSDAAESEVTVSDATLVPGTPGYVAPEVADGRNPSPASDVFSLGATLFAAVEGVSPYGQANPRAQLRRAIARSVATPKQAGPLTPVLAELMAPDPDSRPTAEHARQLLEAVATGRPPVAIRKPRKRSRRVLRWVVPAAVLVVVTTVAAIVLLPHDSPDILADQRGPDPCALLDTKALGRFGTTDLNPYYGDFARCDVLINPGSSQVDVKVEFGNTPPPTGQVQTMSGVTVVTSPVSGGQCDRTLPLPRGNIDITAKVDEGNGPVNLCEIADTATAKAVSVVAAGAIPKRTAQLNPKSLFYSDACTLLDNDALSLFPGVDALHPQPDFGNWGCVWQSTTKREQLTLRFDRDSPPNASDGQPLEIAGHAAFDKGNYYGDGSCEIAVVADQFRDGDDTPKDELLLVVVAGDLPQDQMCAQARTLAAPAVAKLPR
ncbi:serine/threonine-protein kinase [Kutzneria sp. CA-103260]|uniref:serine/threonine-protein kinase n=1 Tax=Kutzneria sp. CA-103260 TaxID=2802641 RepID=UPI001BA5F936|nr:serine/threonine-protein kinase [Kutzneria sp. CA-103260]QUQ67207.1 Serine/threonine-protein kinase PknD [Kutzneria sp. CA-103260]